jgi:hypothetical protein
VYFVQLLPPCHGMYTRWTLDRVFDFLPFRIIKLVNKEGAR